MDGRDMKIVGEEPEGRKDQGNRSLLAVTGGIATGKTNVAKMLEDRGAYTIDFDILAKEVVESFKPTWKEIEKHFGVKVLQAKGHLDRKKLSGIVFRDAAEREKFEAIIHPEIIQEFRETVQRINGNQAKFIVQVIMPLLFGSKPRMG
jgi:dephospho-CoA kinase